MRQFPSIELIVAAAAAALLLSSFRIRRLAGLGAIAFALGSASAAAGAASPSELSALPASSLAVDAGLVLLGILLLGAAGIGAARGGMGWSGAAGLALGLAAVGAAWTAGPLLSAAGAAPALVGALSLALTCGALFQLARLSGAGAAIRRVEARLGSAWDGRREGPLRAAPAALALIGAACACFGSDLRIAVAGTLLAGVAWPLALRQPRRALVVALVAGAALFRATWLMGTIAGSAALATASLRDAPFSDAAETMLVPLLALAAYTVVALWPFWARGSGAVAIVGVALLNRVGWALPGGMQEWETVLVPLGVLSLWLAAIGGRRGPLIAAGAWIACVAGRGSGGAVPSWWLAGAAVLASISELVPPPAARLLSVPAVIAAAVGGSVVLRTALTAQVTYAILAVGAVAVAIASSGPAGTGHLDEVVA